VDPLIETLADPDAPARPFEPETLAKDDTLGRYVVIERLGSGGMGVVYACWDPELDRKLAVKLLLPRGVDEVGSSEGRARLVREAKALAKLSHPNVVSVFDVGTFRDVVYVAMEFVEGRTLAVWARERRPWREVLAVQLQAARGLAAAHAAGLVHRDFKPDNAMIGTDGRVRVMDFGIARRLDLPIESDSEPSTQSDGASPALATTGTAMGTPAYMSPEQHLGLGTDARTDQFSWCVATWEALWGERPFAGETLAALFVAVTEGRTRPVPRGSDVPRSLERVLARGLAPRREERFESMDALVAALERAAEPARSRRFAVAATMVVGLGAAAVGAHAWAQHRARAACSEAGRGIESVWNDDARESLRASLRATGVATADTTIERVMPWLDDYAARWTQLRTSLCVDARLEASVSADFEARATACLEDRREALAATIEVLGEVDASAIPRAVKAAAALDPLEPCLDVRELERRPLPEAGPARERVRELGRALWRAYSLRWAGRHQDALVEARAVVDAATAAQWPPIAIEARALVGNLRGRVGEEAGAIEDLEAAFEAAYAEGLDGLAASIAADLAFSLGVRGARHDEGLRWAKLGQAALERLDESGGIRGAAVENAIGSIHYAKGDYAAAETFFARAVEMRESVLGPDHPEVATPLSNLGVVYTLQGKRDQAEAAYRRAAEISERALGPDHFEVASALSNLGNLEYERGRYEEALQLHERALAIRRIAFAPDNPELGISLAMTGTMLRQLGRYDQALELIEEALRIFERSRGPGHPDVGACLTNLASVHFDRGGFGPARDAWLRAVAIQEKALGAEHVNLVEPLHNLGRVSLELRDHEAALAYFRRALAIREKALGSDHVDVAGDLTGIAEALLELGRAREALPLVERATVIRETTEAPREIEAKTREVLERARQAVRAP
jgi:tetratricopeptide (TPR) repeat protein